MQFTLGFTFIRRKWLLILFEASKAQSPVELERPLLSYAGCNGSSDERSVGHGHNHSCQLDDEVRRRVGRWRCTSTPSAPSGRRIHQLGCSTVSGSATAVSGRLLHQTARYIYYCVVFNQ